MAELADFTRNIVEFCSFLNIKAILLLRNLFLGVIYWQTIFLEKLNHQNLPCRSRWKRQKYFIKVLRESIAQDKSGNTKSIPMNELEAMAESK